MIKREKEYQETKR